MNGRFVLLIVATAIFVRLWMPANRQHSRETTTTHQRCVLPAEKTGFAGHFAAANLVNEGAANVIAAGPKLAERDVSLPLERESVEHWNENTAPIALPPDLEPGRYRVVDQTGRVALLEIPEPANSFGCRPSAFASPEFFVIRNDSTTWYFVRLRSRDSFADRASETRLVPPPEGISSADSSLETPRANRKFDFSGYEDDNAATTPLLPEFAHDRRADMEVVPADPAADARHAALRLALLQRDAERAVRDVAARVTTWWKRTSLNLRQADAAPVAPSL